MDGLGASRSDQREAHASAACRAIQTCMDAADGQRVLVICATNEPWKVDTASCVACVASFVARVGSSQSSSPL